MTDTARDQDQTNDEWNRERFAEENAAMNRRFEAARNSR